MRALFASRPTRDWGATALAAALLAYAFAGALPMIAPATSLFLIGRFHLRSASFLAWAAMQPSGWMYNFENRYLLSPRPLTRAELSTQPHKLTGELRWHTVNHQTARVFTFYEGRYQNLRDVDEQYLYLHGRYRAFDVLTAYHLTTAPGASDGQKRTIARREVLP